MLLEILEPYCPDRCWNMFKLTTIDNLFVASRQAQVVVFIYVTWHHASACNSDQCRLEEIPDHTTSLSSHCKYCCSVLNLQSQTNKSKKASILFQLSEKATLVASPQPTIWCEGLYVGILVHMCTHFLGRDRSCRFIQIHNSSDSVLGTFSACHFIAKSRNPSWRMPLSRRSRPHPLSFDKTSSFIDLSLDTARHAISCDFI